ncbi:MAG: hypothetical protein OXF05_06860, partial [Hyphomicrobiales bacterium]|nr:hypothetical protein [Hyphomicrobiales bacterium]
RQNLLDNAEAFFGLVYTGLVCGRPVAPESGFQQQSSLFRKNSILAGFLAIRGQFSETKETPDYSEISESFLIFAGISQVLEVFQCGPGAPSLFSWLL